MTDRRRILLVDADGTWLRLSILDEDRAKVIGGTAGPSGRLTVTVKKLWKGSWKEAAEVIDPEGATKLSPHDLADSICEAVGIHEAAKAKTKDSSTIRNLKKQDSRRAG